MTPDELRTFALDAFQRVGGSEWPAKLELGLLTLALATGAVALVLSLLAMVEGRR